MFGGEARTEKHPLSVIIMLGNEVILHADSRWIAFS